MEKKKRQLNKSTLPLENVRLSKKRKKKKKKKKRFASRMLL